MYAFADLGLFHFLSDVLWFFSGYFVAVMNGIFSPFSPWLCCVFITAWTLSSCCKWELYSCCGSQILGHTGFSGWGSWALEHRLNSCGLVTLWHEGSSQIRDWPHVSCTGRKVLYQEPPGKPINGILSLIFRFDCSLLVYRNSTDFCISCNLTKHSYYFKWIPLQVFYVDDHVTVKKKQFYFLIINRGAFYLLFLCYCTGWNFQRN